MRIGIIILFISLLALAACSGTQPLPNFLGDTASSRQESARAGDRLLASDSTGPIAPPTLPPKLEAAAESRPEPLDSQGIPFTISYTVKCDSPDAPKLADTFMKASHLTRLQDVPIHTLMALEQRLISSLDDGRDILHSFGYYGGKVEGWIEEYGNIVNLEELEAQTEGELELPLTVRITFKPGPQYTMGKTKVIRLDREDDPDGPLDENDGNDGEKDKLSAGRVPPITEEAGILPQTLADTGLKQGAPAIAQDVLDAVDKVEDAFKDNGYPFARISYTRYILDNENLQLEATVALNPQKFMRMGGIDLSSGNNNVNPRYINFLKTWNEGEPWNQSRVEMFRNSLRQSGLFQSIDLKPSESTDKNGNHPVSTALASAPERTIGASAKYDTSFGAGMQGFWEHRNFTGNGDLLRTELSLWKDLQELVGRYRFPFIFGPDYDFIAQGGVLHQDTDAYKLKSARAAAGIDWRISPKWSLSGQGTVEGGWIKDPDKPKHDYRMLGLPLAASFSSTNSLLDATDGGRAVFSIIPYKGYYDGDFNVLRSRLDLERFVPLVGEDKLVLALRGAVGALSGADSPEVPPSARFYSGGGGSVRGYEYQSLGPRNKNKDPLGGSSMLEMTVEPRYRINDTFGVVAFIDGGMVYEEMTDPRFGQDIQWGAGVGVRLYTVIGPARLDVATPVNPRSGDAPLHFYISIGQSF